MSTKNIEVNPNKIEIKKYIGSTWYLTFSTNFKYLKTDATGVLKAGGFQRCPVIAGSGNYISDNTGYGGFPAVVPKRLQYIVSGAQDIIATVPNGGSISPSNFGCRITPYTAGASLGTVYTSSTKYIINSGGGWVGTFKWAILSWNSSSSKNAQFSIYITDVSTTLTEGIYTFPKLTSDLTWTTPNNPYAVYTTYDLYNVFSSSTTYYDIAPISIITAPVSLSLAVTA